MMLNPQLLKKEQKDHPPEAGLNRNSNAGYLNTLFQLNLRVEYQTL